EFHRTARAPPRCLIDRRIPMMARWEATPERAGSAATARTKGWRPIQIRRCPAIDRWTTTGPVVRWARAPSIPRTPSRIQALVRWYGKSPAVPDRWYAGNDPSEGAGRLDLRDRSHGARFFS